MLYNNVTYFRANGIFVNHINLFTRKLARIIR